MARLCETIPVDIRPEKGSEAIIRASECIQYEQTFTKSSILLPVPKIDPILGRLHKTLRISATFPNMTRPTALTTDMHIHQKTSLMLRNPLRSWTKILISNYYLLEQH